MMIGFFAATPLCAAVAETAVAVATTAAMPVAITAHLARPLMLLLPLFLLGLPSGRYLFHRLADSRLPRAVERSSRTARELDGCNVPQRVRPCVAERPVVAEDLD